MMHRGRETCYRSLRCWTRETSSASRVMLEQLYTAMPRLVPAMADLLAPQIVYGEPGCTKKVGEIAVCEYKAIWSCIMS